MRALPLAIFPTIVILAGSIGLLGNWLSASGTNVESSPPAASHSVEESPQSPLPFEDRIVAEGPPAAESAPPKASEVSIATKPSQLSSGDEWTDARWTSFVRKLRARFGNAVIHVEDYRRWPSAYHKMLKTQRRFHDTMQSSDLKGHLKLARIATDSRERDLNAAIETLEVPARLFDQLVAIRQTNPSQSGQFAPLLEEVAEKCEAAGNAFELARAHWTSACEHENRTFARVWKVHELKTKSDAFAEDARHRMAWSLGQSAQSEARSALNIAESNRDLIRTYRSFNVLQVEGELQKVDNLAVQNQKFAEELNAMARTLFQSSRMSETELSRHRKKVQALSAKVDANEAEIDRALAAVKVRIPPIKSKP